ASLGPGSYAPLSTPSSTPSLSLSCSEQTSSSCQPSLSSGVSGHLSTLSRMPSPSRSFGASTGQPWFSGGPGRFGHLSSLSSTPSPSLSVVSIFTTSGELLTVTVLGPQSLDSAM